MLIIWRLDNIACNSNADRHPQEFVLLTTHTSILHPRRLRGQRASLRFCMHIANLLIYHRSQATNTMNNGTVAGITVAAVVSFFILLGLFGLLYRRRAQRTEAAQLNSSSSAYPRSDSIARSAAAHQMTTVPNPFYLSSPYPPSQDDGPSIRKGHFRFPSFPRALQNPSTSSVRHPYFVLNLISEKSVRTAVF
jgi:hypothetical protein